MIELRQHRGLFTEAKERKYYATLLSRLIAGRESDHVPYLPNEHNDYFWTLDTGNDWKVKFFPGDDEKFAITYRYEGTSNTAEERFAGWLEHRLGVDIE